MKAWLHGRLSRISGAAPPGSRELLGNAGSLVGSIAVTSLLGFPYWWLAARSFPAEAVGFAATTVSAMTLLGTFGMLGLGTLLTGELPRRTRDRESFLATGLAFSAGAGLVLGLAFAVVAPGPLGLHDLAGKPGPIGLFAIGVALTAVAMVIDQALVGLLRGTLQLRRNIIFSVTKLVLVAGVGLAALSGSGEAIYATWVGGLLLSLAWLALVVIRRGAGIRRFQPRWSVAREWRRPALEHHLLNLAIQGPSLAMPLVITATISVTASAYFYAAALITSFLSYGAISLTYALYAVGVRDPANLRVALRYTLRLSFAVILLANVVLAVGAPFILKIFGSGYSENAAGALRVLGLIIVLVVIKDHYIAIHRIRGTVLNAAKLCTAGAALELGLAAAGGLYGGLTWAALGALTAITLEASVMAPTLLRELGITGRGSAAPAGEAGPTPTVPLNGGPSNGGPPTPAMDATLQEHDIESLLPEWAELFAADDSATPFQSPAWARAWWRHWGTAARPWILMVRDNGRPIGLLPLCSERMLGLRLLRANGEPAEYWDLIARPDSRRAVEAVVGHELRHRHREWDALVLSQLPPRSTTPAALERSGIRTAHRTTVPCPGIELPDSFEAYLGTLPSGRRASLRHRLRSLDQRELELRVPAVEELRDAIERWQLLRIRQCSAMGTPLPPVQTTPKFRDFLVDVTTELVPAGLAMVWEFVHDGEVVGSFVNFCDDHTFYRYLGACAPELGRLAIGEVATAEGIRSSIAAGRAYYDFTPGDGEDKDAYGAVDRLSPTVILRSSHARSIVAGRVGAAAGRLTDVAGRLRA